MNRRQYYSILFPAAGIIYVIAMFLLDWNGTAVVVGALIIALLAISGRFVPLPAGAVERDRVRDR